MTIGTFWRERLPTPQPPGPAWSSAMLSSRLFEEIATTADLRPLFGLLITVPDPPDALEPREVIASEAIASTELPPTAIDLVPAAEALTARGAGPVVRLGTQGFQDLAIALWFHLWPELRVRFVFRLSFGPHDIVDTPKPSLVCMPTALAAR